MKSNIALHFRAADQFYTTLLGIAEETKDDLAIVTTEAALGIRLSKQFDRSQRTSKRIDEVETAVVNMRRLLHVINE